MTHINKNVFAQLIYINIVFIQYIIMSISNNSLKCKCFGPDCVSEVIECLTGCFKILKEKKLILAGCNKFSICQSEPGFCHFTSKISPYCCCNEEMCNNNPHIKYSYSFFNETSTPSPFTPPYTVKSKIHIYIWPFLIASIIFITIGFILVRRKFRWLSYGLAKNSINDKLAKEDVDEIEMKQKSFPKSEGITEITRYCKIISQLGHGRFGKIWLGELNYNDTVKNVAIKIFKEADKRSWENELTIFKYKFMNHPDILKYIGFDSVDVKEDRTSLVSALNYSDDAFVKNYWIVTEYQRNGSCFDFLKKNTLSIEQMLRIGISISRGLTYLHSEEFADSTAKPLIVHRDLKSSNILIKDDFNNACIADFGFAIIFETGTSIGDSHFQVGTRRYMAPEVIDGAIQFSRESFMRIDVYAMALIFWELLWRTRNSPNLEEQVEDHQLPFQFELGDNPSIEALHSLILINRARPRAKSWWSTNETINAVWESIQQSWDHDAEARLPAGCIYERFSNILREYLTKNSLVV